MTKKVKTRGGISVRGERQRIQKYLSGVGVGSRRGIEALLKQERISVNGRLARLGDSVSDGDRVSIDGRRSRKVKLQRTRLRVLAYNKPTGVICSKDGSDKWDVVYSDLPKEIGFRWVSVGRLDVNTSGLLLFTNDGELASRLMHPSYEIDREYAARIYGDVTDLTLKSLLSGVEIDGVRLRFSDVVKGRGEGANRWYTCVIQAGRNREVRRTWESQGVQVSRLMRVRFANILLPIDLRPGDYIELGEPLIQELCNLVRLEKLK